MPMKVKYNNKYFKILNNFGYKNSNNEVTFNDITIDFTGCKIADIPYKFQEIKIIEEIANEEDKVLFTGFLDSVRFSQMKDKNENKELILTLLSPLKLATKRYVSLIGTYKLKYAIQRVIQPLLNDGFVLKELNIPEGQITTNFLLETIENCMNSISNQRNIFWYINENKEIFINSIDYLFALPVKKSINQDEIENGLLKIQPSIENIDYANIINFKNIRLIYPQLNNSFHLQDGYPVVTIGKQIKYGDIINFDNPIIVDENQLRNIVEEGNFPEQEPMYDCLNMVIQLSGGTSKTYRISLDETQGSVNYNKYITQGSITYNNDEEEGEIVLQRDNFFQNLITGFKWNVDSNATITYFRTLTALRYTTMRFMYSPEINKLKGIISNSGQIEKTIDYAEKWTSLTKLIDYARSLIVQNSNIINQVELEYDVNPNVNIGDIISINEPDFFIKGDFAVKDISYKYYNNLKQIWKLTLKNADILTTFIDLFRPQETQVQDDILNTIILSEFVEEKINETHTIVKVGFN